MKARKVLVFLLVLGLALWFSTSTALAKHGSGAYGKSYGYGTWIELTPSYQAIYSMTFSVPATVYGYVDCDGYAYMKNCEVEIAMGIDSTSEDVSTRRFYSYATGATDTSGIHTSRLYKFNPGTHTIYFLARVFSGGTGWESRANYMSISVLIFQTGGFKGPEAMEVEPGIAPDGSWE